MPCSTLDPLEELAKAYLDGVACMRALVLGIEAGAVDLGVEQATWDSAMTKLEAFVTELLTNDFVSGGPPVTSDDVQRVHRLKEHAREAMQQGKGSPELCELAVQCLEILWGADWRETVSWEGAFRGWDHHGSRPI